MAYAPTIGVGVTAQTDRKFYAVMAVVFLSTAVIGFAPNSYAILTGTMESPPLIGHIHAFLMLSWLLLLVTQTTLVASGNQRLHQRLGIVSFALIPTMVVVMVAASVFAYWEPGEPVPLLSNILLLQLRAFVLFPAFALWALMSRRHAPETHKRMMLMATIVLLDAAVSRITWLPGAGFDKNYELFSLYQLLLIAPAIGYDILRFGRVHHVYVIAIGVFVFWAVVGSILWNSTWWLQTAPTLLGVGG